MVPVYVGGTLTYYKLSNNCRQCFRVILFTVVNNGFIMLVSSPCK